MAFDPRRIAIIKPSALGDIAHALPVLTALRDRYPAAEISWVVNKSFEPLLAGHPHLTETIAFDRAAFRRGTLEAVAYSARFAALLRRRRFDLVVDLQGLLRTGLMTAATGAAVRVGFANAREGSRHFYTHRVAVDETAHAVEWYWEIAKFLGAGDLPKRFVLPVRAEETAAVALAMRGFPRPWVAMAAGARWVTKRWPTRHFADLANRMYSSFGGTVILVGAPDDIALSQEVAALLHGPFLDLTGKTPLPRLVAVLAESDGVVANDTGPLHVAAALGRPCIAPYTCTKTARHGPYTSPGGGVETTVPCGGSYLRQCPHGTVCFADLTPDRLWPPLERVLHTWAARSRSA